MDHKILHDEFRQQLTNVHALTVITVSLLEMIGYIILIISGVETFALDNAYLWHGVVIPMVVNAITHLVVRGIVNNPSLRRRRKNRSVIVAALITAFVVAVAHKEYIVTSCAFIFPMMLSAMFNDKKLLNASLLGSVFILLCVGGLFWWEGVISLATGLNLVILFGFAWISYLCGILSINFSHKSLAAIEYQVKRNDKLMKDMQKDQMTRLYNHSTFINRLDEMIAAHDPDRSLCLVIVDVDDFKHINDTYGHDCGDTVLIQLAHILRKHCADCGTAYRYGGEEFTILFDGKDEAETCRVVQNILDEFGTYKFSFTNASVTFSAGVARYRQGETRDEFFESADRTLYLAKREGKNRVLIDKEACYA